MSNGTLAVDQGVVEQEAAQIANAKQCMTLEAISSIDSETTLPENEACRSAFQKAGTSAESLGSALDTDVENIRQCGLSFAEFDAMIGAANRKSDEGNIETGGKQR